MSWVPMYAERDALLKKHLSQTYAQYLASDLWQRIRASVLHRASHRCQLCHGHATQVHHAKYTPANLLGSTYKHLVAICATCHKGIERSGDQKLPPDQVGELLKTVRQADVNGGKLKQERITKRTRLTVDELAARRKMEAKDTL